MATREEIKNNKTFLVVKHHSICEESKVPKDGFEAVDVFDPKRKETITKYIDKWGAVSGYITDVVAYDTENNYETRFQGFKISIDDEVVLDLPHKTIAYDSFCKAGENIDFSKEVTFSAYHNRAKDRTGFSIKQDGESVAWIYTRDNMGDCPAWEVDEDGEPDSRKQRAFLKSRVVDVVIPKAKAAAESRSGEENEAQSPNTSVVGAPEIKVAAATASGTTAKGKSKAKTPETINSDVDINSDDIPF